MTRCGILIEDKESNVWIRRYCDGYPKATGTELVDFLSTGTNYKLSPEEMLSGLMFKYGEHYEPAESLPGDADYFYHITCNGDSAKLEWFRVQREYYSYLKNPTEELIPLFNREYPNEYNIARGDDHMIGNLKKAYAEVNYSDKIDLAEMLGQDTLDKLYIDDDTLREMITEKVKERLAAYLSFELIYKK